MWSHFSLSHLDIVLACLFGVLMTWGVGANDLANIMSTTIGSKAVSIRTAIIIAIIFEFAGAFFGGAHVTQTMRNGIINIEALNNDPQVLINGMLAVLLASMTWVNVASYWGLPVSITNAIVGALVGFGTVVLGPHAIHWKQVGSIATSWILAPCFAGVAAYLLFTNIQHLILARRDPIKHARRTMPFYLFFVSLILAFMTVIKGLIHLGFPLDWQQKSLITLLAGVGLSLLGMFLIRRIPTHGIFKRRERFAAVERMFGVLMAFTACAMVFAHGSNDVAVAVGPMTVIYCVVVNGGSMLHMNAYPAWIMLLGTGGVVAGLLMYGHKVIETVGSGITALTPSRAFAATIAASTAVVISTSIGIPVSATQTLVGGVLGVGLARGIGALNLVVIRNIFMSWLITVPAASGLTIVFYYFFQAVLVRAV